MPIAKINAVTGTIGRLRQRYDFESSVSVLTSIHSVPGVLSERDGG
jgi:hypothetical protein